MRKLKLNQLALITTGISKKVSEFLGEAAQVCLELNGHKSGVEINVEGLFNETVIVEWDKDLDEETLLSWKDINEATEYGATAIALLLIIEFSNYNFVERLPQSELGDYFLKRTNLDVPKSSDEAFLEISGIFKANLNNRINVRINQKKKQLRNKPFDSLNILIAVVEFSLPLAKIEKL